MMNRTPRSTFAAWLAIAAFGSSLVPANAWAQGSAPAPAPADATKAAGTDAEPAAPNDEAIAEAARRYDLGLKLYAEGEFRLAVIEFERTYQITKDYRVLYNIGQVRIQLGNYARAIGALNEYLKSGGDKISDDRRKAVQADLDMLAARTGHVRITANVPGADILIDDLPVGVSPLADPVLLDAGEHKITARKTGYDARAVQLTLAGRDSELVTLHLVKIPEQSVIVKEVEKESDSTWMIAMWTATGVLAVGAGVTGGLGIKAANDLEDLRDEEGSTNDERESASDRANTLLLAADIMGGAAIVTGGIALYLTLSGTGSSKDEPPTTKSKAAAAPALTGFGIGPNRVVLRGEF